MKYKIPLFDLNFNKQEEQAVIETIRSKWISTGPKCNELEKLFSDMLNVKHAVSLANCTGALHLALKSIGIDNNSEVICPSLTFAATVNSIKYLNAQPVFCDISSTDNLNIDSDKIEDLITSKTKAIIVMHFAGFPCDMDKIMHIARKHNIKVIEDACHAPLSEYNGKKVGSIGDIACYSFFSNKNISTGEGGMLVTNDENIAKKVKLLRSHGMTTLSYERAKGHATEYDIVDIGYNYRLDDIRASIAIVQVKKLESDLIKRAKVREMYLELLSKCDEIIIPFKENLEFVSNYVMPIVLKDSNYIKRNEIRECLHSKGIQTSIHYPAVHRFTFYHNKEITLPVTDYVTDNEITLPMYANLSEDEIKYICKNLIDCLND